MSDGAPVHSKTALQYKKWVYPEPIEDLDAFVAAGHKILGSPGDVWPAYWPRHRAFAPLNVLVAGCGTNQAAYYAFKNPSCRFTGIDVSAESLERQSALAKRHGISNLTLLEKDILEAASLGESYDLIVSTGVLHHLEDPDAGMRALVGCLKPEGILDLMLYARGLRVGVYMLQEAFLLLGMPQTQRAVDVVKEVLKSIPQHHTVRAYVGSAKADMSFDAGIVDTFLHRVDRAYSVPEIYDFCENNGAAFMGWEDGFRYALDSNFPPGHAIFEFAAGIDARTEAHVADLLTQSQGVHRFFAAHPAHVAANRIDFAPGVWEDFVPMWHPNLKKTGQAEAATQFSRDGHHFRLAKGGTRILDLCDGKRRLGDIRAVFVGEGIAAGHAEREILRLIQSMNKFGHIFILI